MIVTKTDLVVKYSDFPAPALIGDKDERGRPVRYWGDPVQRTQSWPQLVERFRNPPRVADKFSCPLISFTAFGGLRSKKGSLRHDANALEIHGVMGDYDAGRMPAAEAARLLAFASIRAVIYTSASHAPGNHRWRVVAPFTRPHLPGLYREMVARLNGALGGVLTDESFKLSQPFFYGQASELYECHEVGGDAGAPLDALVDVGIAPDPVYPTGQERAPRESGHTYEWTATTLAEVRFALQYLSAGEDCSGDVWRQVGSALKSSEGTEWEETARQLFHDWSATSNADSSSRRAYRPEDVDSWWERASSDQVSPRSIFEKARLHNPAFLPAQAALVASLGDAQARAGQLEVACKAAEAAKAAQVTVKQAPEVRTQPEAMQALLSDRTYRTGAGQIKGDDRSLTLGVVALGVQLRFEEFASRIEVCDEGRWRDFTDDDQARISRRLVEDLNFCAPEKTRLRDMIALLASEHKVDRAREWVLGLEWDGVPRVEAFMPRYARTGDSPYARAVGRYLFTALAGRVLDPGCKADMVPVLSGPQGYRKSSLVAALAPWADAFCEFDLSDLKHDDSKRAQAGRLVLEFGELRGMRMADHDSLKTWMTKASESWTEKYREHRKTYLRRWIGIGTTNEAQFLTDATGNRRYLPLTVLAHCDVNLAQQDRDQLWAEGVQLWRHGGVRYREAEDLARPQHEGYTREDPWLGPLEAWLNHLAPGAEFALVDAAGALGINPEGCQRHSSALSQKLRSLGCVHIISGKSRSKRWTRCK